MAVLPITISDEAFLRLPYRVRKACGEGVLVRHKVGTNSFLIPAAIDIERWKPSWMSALLAELLPRSPGAFLDVGVNRLQTFFDLRSLDTDRSYVGFEPNPACSTYAWQVFRLNPSSPNLILSCALSDASGVLDLWMTRNSEYDSCATTIKELRPGRDVVRLSAPASTLDSMIGGLGIAQIGLVKIDVEGGELAVLQGASDTLSSARPLVLCEVLHRDQHAAAEPHRHHLRALHDLLRHMRYSVYQIVTVNGEKSGRNLRLIDAFDDLVWTEQTAADCDYVFCPIERTELLGHLI